jgi:hypothetical protein
MVFPEEKNAEEYPFEAAEIEKKPYHFGGYLEAMPILFVLDKGASLYKLNFYNRSVGGVTPEYDGTLQLEGSLEKIYPVFTLRPTPPTATTTPVGNRIPFFLKETSL